MITGEYLFQPKHSGKFSKDADHLAQMIELLGHFPRPLMRGKYADDLFNKRGEIRGIKALNIWLLKDVLIEKYHFKEEDATGLTQFLLPMLEIDYKRRATAKECLEHPWLKINNE